MDNDSESKKLLTEMDASYLQSLRDCGLVNLYNQNDSARDEWVQKVKAQTVCTAPVALAIYGYFGACI